MLLKLGINWSLDLRHQWPADLIYEYSFNCIRFFPPLFFINRVVLFQIWKTEYTRVQLPGHEECSVSQGHVLSSAPEEAGNTNTLHLKN